MIRSANIYSRFAGKRLISKSAFVFLILLSWPLYGEKKFKSSYVSFNIQRKWICKSFGVEWLCHHSLYKGTPTAFMLITARLGGKSDPLSSSGYFFNGAQTVFSHKIRLKNVQVNRHTWTDSFYRISLVDDRRARYASTICCKNMKTKIHISVSFHAHQANYTKYSREFLRAINSLKLSEKIKEVLEKIKQQTQQHREEMISYIEKILFEDERKKERALKEKSSSKPLLLFVSLALFLLGALAYFLYRKNKPKSGKPKKQPLRRGKGKPSK